MIDINELRHRAELGYKVASDIVIELLDRLEAAEKERDALRAKIEAMEKQEPVAEWVDGAFDQYPHLRWREPYKAIAGAKLYTKFYALPGAHPAPSVPEGWIQRGMAELEAIRSRQDDDTLLDDRTLIERIGKAMLAAAPEAKP